MSYRPPTENAAFLRDLASQTSCLEDARRTGSSRAMVHALEAVIGVRGLNKLSSDAKVAPTEVTARLSRAQAGDADGLFELIEQLIATWTRPSHRRDRINDKK